MSGTNNPPSSLPDNKSSKEYFEDKLYKTNLDPRFPSSQVPDINNKLDDLTAQLTLLFYGTEALQEYREDKDLVPITVYQAVKLINQLITEARIEEVNKALGASIKREPYYFNNRLFDLEAELKALGDKK